MSNCIASSGTTFISLNDSTWVSSAAEFGHLGILVHCVYLDHLELSYAWLLTYLQLFRNHHFDKDHQRTSCERESISYIPSMCPSMLIQFWRGFAFPRLPPALLGIQSSVSFLHVNFLATYSCLSQKLHPRLNDFELVFNANRDSCILVSGLLDCPAPWFEKNTGISE